jgi:tetratricopeptide (TPR) repeat protein
MALDIMRRKNLTNGFFLTVFYSVAQGYHALGRMEEAERTCLDALEVFPTHLDMCHLLASIYFRRKAMEPCKTISERYLQIYDTFEKNPSLLGSTYYHSYAKRHEIYFGLALVHFLGKDLESADAFFMKSFEDTGKKPDKAESICRFYFGEQVNDKALQWLILAYQTGIANNHIPAILEENKELFLRIGKIFLREGDRKTAADCLHKAADEGLTADERLEKKLLQISLYWHMEATDELIQSLESLLEILDMQTQYTLQSVEDLGQILYDIAETLCLRQQWTSAESALQIAYQIAPALFDHHKFERLLTASTSIVNNPS